MLQAVFIESVFTSRGVANRPGHRPSGNTTNVSGKDLEATDLADILVAPVTKTQTDHNNVKACTFYIASDSSMTMGLREGDEVRRF